MKSRISRWIAVLLLMVLMACGDAPKEYAGQGDIREDLGRLYKAKQTGDEATLMAVSGRLLTSKQTIGVVRITPLIYRAEVLARHGKIEEVNSLFAKQFPFVSKSTGNCGRAVFTAMKADVWQEAGRTDLAVADYTAAIDRCPRLDNAYSKLSLIYSTAADPAYVDAQKALVLAQKALDVGICSKSLNAVAAAYARAGQYDLAVVNLGKAVEAAEKEHQPPAKIESFRKRLSIYQAKAVK